MNNGRMVTTINVISQDTVLGIIDMIGLND